MKIETNLKVKMKDSLMKKIEVIVSDFNMEISGFLIGQIKGNDIIINDIIFPKQTVSGASVDIKAEDIIPLRNDSRWKDVIGLWHSHCHMGTFWSGGEGDESHIKFISQSKNITVFIVSSFNQNRYNHLVRIEIQKPFKISIDECELESINKSVDNQKILNEIRGYVVEKTYPVVKSIGKYPYIWDRYEDKYDYAKEFVRKEQEDKLIDNFRDSESYINFWMNKGGD